MFYTTKQNLLKDKLYKVPSMMKKALEKQKYSISKQQKGERKTGNININITIITREIEPKNQVPNKKIGLTSTIINTLWKIFHSNNIL